jgi:hypothetical protein
MAEALAHHLGVEQRAGMQRVGGQRRRVAPRREIDRRHDHRQFRLAVGAPAGIAARQHDVGKVDRLLARRGEVDDARRPGRPRRRLQRRAQQVLQQERRQVVDGKAHLVALRTLLAAVDARRRRADAGVRQQHVECGMVGGDRGGEAAHLVEVGEIVGIGFDALAAARRGDGVARGSQFRGVAAVLFKTSFEEVTCNN